MSESFGAGLRRRREDRQVSLTTIVEQTKIKQALLEGLERDDVSGWPAGIFRRAFIRAYAHAIGLDPDCVLREFLERHPDPIEQIDLATAFAVEPDTSTVSEATRNRLRGLVGAAMDAVAHFRRGATQLGRPVVEDSTASGSAPPPAVVASNPDLCAAAHLCTELGQLDNKGGAAPLLQRAASILDAVGLIVWVWDPKATALSPVLAHGYSDEVLAQLPKVRREDDNATASAFRSAQTTVVNGGKLVSGALVVPLMTPKGCAGVLAVELKPDTAPSESVRSVVTIFAAQLARLFVMIRPAKAIDRKLA